MQAFHRKMAAFLSSCASMVLVTVASLAPVGAVPALAAPSQVSVTDPNSSITASAPATYGFSYPNCPQSAFGPDAVTFTNIHPSQSLSGWIQLEQLNADGSRQNLGSPITVSFSGASGTTVTYPITYPGFRGVPVNAQGTQEFHVDLSVGVFTNGVQVSTFDGTSNGTNIVGPLDWDTFCSGNPPPTTDACTVNTSIQSNLDRKSV